MAEGVEESRVVGVSFRLGRLARLDDLAKAEGVSRSEMVGRLVDRVSGDSLSGPDVRVDGRRFVPARGKA